MDAIRELLKRTGLRPSGPGGERNGQGLSAQLEELRRENRDLRAQGVVRAKLFAAAVHDLRQPMQAVMLFSEALADEARSPSQQRAAARMCQSVEELERMSSGMLELCQLEPPEHGRQEAALDLTAMFDDVSRTFGALARQRGLRLVVRPTDLSARGDATTLARVLGNLVSNALHNTQKGGVLVGARRDKGAVRIDVCDTGDGLARELDILPSDPRSLPAASHVLAPEPELPSACGGLGLATVRHLAELVGARIGLRSTHGRGTTVSIYLAT